jgi:hypothetical protein
VLILACGHEIIHKTLIKYYINWLYDFSNVCMPYVDN